MHDLIDLNASLVFFVNDRYLYKMNKLSILGEFFYLNLDKH